MHLQAQLKARLRASRSLSPHSVMRGCWNAFFLNVISISFFCEVP